MSGQWWESNLIVGPFSNITEANAWAAANPNSLFLGLLATSNGQQISWGGAMVGWIAAGGGIPYVGSIIPTYYIADYIWVTNPAVPLGRSRMVWNPVTLAYMWAESYTPATYLIVDHSENAPYTMVYKHAKSLVDTRVLSTSVVPALSQATGAYTRSVRDPFIARFNGVYVCVYTDSAFQTIPANGAGFGFAVSKDLLTWVDKQIIPGSLPGATTFGYIWAPKLFAHNGDLYVTFAANVNTSGFQIYIAKIIVSQSTTSPYAESFTVAAPVALAINTTSQPETVIQLRMYDPMVFVRQDGSMVIAMSDARPSSGHYTYVAELHENAGVWSTSPIISAISSNTENAKIVLSEDGLSHYLMCNNLANPGKNIYVKININTLETSAGIGTILKIPQTTNPTGENYLPVPYDFCSALHAIA